VDTVGRRTRARGAPALPRSGPGAGTRAGPAPSPTRLVDPEVRHGPSRSGWSFGLYPARCKRPTPIPKRRRTSTNRTPSFVGRGSKLDAFMPGRDHNQTRPVAMPEGADGSNQGTRPQPRPELFEDMPSLVLDRARPSQTVAARCACDRDRLRLADCARGAAPGAEEALGPRHIPADRPVPAIGRRQRGSEALEVLRATRRSHPPRRGSGMCAVMWQLRRIPPWTGSARRPPGSSDVTFDLTSSTGPPPRHRAWGCANGGGKSPRCLSLLCALRPAPSPASFLATSTTEQAPRRLRAGPARIPPTGVLEWSRTSTGVDW
jgi:hypothetical protein